MKHHEVFSDEYFMNEALKEAEKAAERDEIPVGAIVVADNRIVARGHNLTESLTDVTAHAEMQVITAASNSLGSKFLEDCTLYVTLEPCVMCAGACYWARFKKIVIGARDEKRGFMQVGKNLVHPKTEIKTGVLENECSRLLTHFFMHKRASEN